MQNALQSMTHRLPGPISSLGSLILGHECYTTLIYNVDPTIPCLRLALSKALGIGIIIFGSILKIPQIYKIIRHSSARGISLSMYSLEVLAYDISLAYAFRKKLPISTYGENASLTVQNMIITLLIIYYTPKGLHSQQHDGGLLTSAGSSIRLRFGNSNAIRSVLLAAAGMISLSVFLFILCPPMTLSVLQAFSIPISLMSKFPQIIILNRNKEPGHLSAIVVFAQLMGTIARVYTTVVETGDWLIGIGFALASVLNAVIAVQVSAEASLRTRRGNNVVCFAVRLLLAWQPYALDIAHICLIFGSQEERW
jgi:mannose-P-dolichol utilization defect protein 1